VDEYSTLLDSLKDKPLQEAAKAVLVVWEDIWDHTETWIDFPLPDEELAGITMRTLGYLVQANEKVLIVAGTVDLTNESMSQVTVLPKGCIKSVTVL
jgi:hypothetical protein